MSRHYDKAEHFDIALHVAITALFLCMSCRIIFRIVACFALIEITSLADSARRSLDPTSLYWDFAIFPCSRGLAPVLGCTALRSVIFLIIQVFFTSPVHILLIRLGSMNPFSQRLMLKSSDSFLSWHVANANKRVEKMESAAMRLSPIENHASRCSLHLPSPSLTVSCILLFAFVRHLAHPGIFRPRCCSYHCSDREHGEIIHAH